MVRKSSSSVDEPWYARLLKRSRLLLVMLATYLLAVAIVAKWFLKYFVSLAASQPKVFAVVALAPLAFITLLYVIPEAIVLLRQRRRKVIALSATVPDLAQPYFRLDPYVSASPSNFFREDNAHLAVFQWISTTDRPILFLSGSSGAGKSSVLQGYVLPMLRSAAHRVVEIRQFSDSMQILNDAVSSPRKRGTRLLLVLDQFEEFVIVDSRPDHSTQEALLNRIRQLVDTPIPGLTLLLSFRTEYQGAIISLAIENLDSRENWKEIAPFHRATARRFLEHAPQSPSSTLVEKMLDGADALEDTPGLYRPIVLNMLGLVLQSYDTAFIGRAEKAVQTYLQAALAERPIKDIASAVVSGMITEFATKRVVTVGDLCALTQLRKSDVVACLVRLSARGLARSLGDDHTLWELSHDFVARQFALLLARLRFNAAARVVSIVVPIIFAAGMAIAIYAVPSYMRIHAQEQFTQGGSIGKDVYGNTQLTMDYDTGDYKGSIADLVQYGQTIGATSLSLAGYSNDRSDFVLLNKYHGLSVLDLSDSNLGDTELRQLDFLPRLLSLTISNTEITDLSPLRALTAADRLDISGLTGVTDISAIGELHSLHEFLLDECSEISEFVSLRNLAKLQTLYLANTQFQDTTILSELRTLSSLNLAHTKVTNLAGLTPLHHLVILDLSGLNLLSLSPLFSNASIGSLTLEKTQIREFDEIGSLASLYNLDLDYTTLQDVGFIRRLTRLKSLSLVGTKVSDLSPLLALTHLAVLNIRGTGIDIHDSNVLELSKRGVDIDILEPARERGHARLISGKRLEIAVAPK